MKNIRTFFLLFFVVIISFVFAQKTSAQTNPNNPGSSGASSSQRWVCLQADWCADGTTQCRSTGSPVHTVKISAKPDLKLLSNIDTYIVECLSNGTSGEICSSGKPDVDMKIYNTDNSAKMASMFGYKFDKMVLASDGVTPASNPTKSNVAGDIGPFEWESSTPEMHARKFLAVNFFNGVFADPGSSGGQQQGTLDFETSAKNCEAFNWDPFGRVFDSKTLEPLKGVSVSLMKKRDTGDFTVLSPSEVVGGAVVNPQQTESDGSFSFVVPDATYHLVPSLAGYKFPVDSVSSLNPNYSKMYKDVYPAGTGMDIVQRGAIVHRDIAMEPTGASQNNPVELLEYFNQLDKLTNSYIIEGKVSHPFATINVWTKKTDSTSNVNDHFRKVVSVDADKTGYFKLVINQKDFEANETIGSIELVKKTTTASAANSKLQSFVQKIIHFFIPQVSAQTRANPTIVLNPIPNYLEGIAYDRNGKPLANATVGVYLTFSNKAYYTTTADTTGHFRITSEYLPFLPFTLKYQTAAGVTVPVTIDKFMSQNSQYIQQNGINVNGYKDSKGRSGEQVLQAKGQNAADKMAMKNDTSNADNNASSNNFTVIILVIMLIVILAVILVLYIRNKKKMPSIDV